MPKAKRLLSLALAMTMLLSLTAFDTLPPGH